MVGDFYEICCSQIQILLSAIFVKLIKSQINKNHGTGLISRVLQRPILIMRAQRSRYTNSANVTA